MVVSSLTVMFGYSCLTASARPCQTFVSSGDPDHIDQRRVTSVTAAAAPAAAVVVAAAAGEPQHAEPRDAGSGDPQELPSVERATGCAA